MVATPFSYGTFIHYSLPALIGAPSPIRARCEYASTVGIDRDGLDRRFEASDRAPSPGSVRIGDVDRAAETAERDAAAVGRERGGPDVVSSRSSSPSQRATGRRSALRKNAQRRSSNAFPSRTHGVK